MNSQVCIFKIWVDSHFFLYLIKLYLLGGIVECFKRV